MSSASGEQFVESSLLTLDFNPEFARALELLEHSDEHIFLTGRAGTGKSTLLRQFRLYTKKKVVVLAPTGVAAVNVAGQTIHSFFGFKPDTTLKKVKSLQPKKPELYKKLQTIVIDEISMVRADLLDCIDIFLRKFGPDKKRPFGGIQMVFIGDLYQLPPVVSESEKELFGPGGLYSSPYFFSAHVISPPAQLFDVTPLAIIRIELQKVYRQRDTDFVHLLNLIRNNTVTKEHITQLNTRHDPSYRSTHESMEISLMTTNSMADEMNATMLEALEGKEYLFGAQVEGDFEKKAYPADETLRLKVGAQVMMQNNDMSGRWINGTMGVVVSIEEEQVGDSAALAALSHAWGEAPQPATTSAPPLTKIKIRLQDGIEVIVMPHTWDMYEFHYNKKSNSVESESIGSFTQYPLRLAWAVTIHKAQGKTFDRVVLDIGRGTFAPGQLYVALSRCTTFEGLILRRPVALHHIWIDEQVVLFMGQAEGEKKKKSA